MESMKHLSFVVISRNNKKDCFSCRAKHSNTNYNIKGEKSEQGPVGAHWDSLEEGSERSPT